MDCDDIHTKIEPYLDAELTLSDRRDFEEHIEHCKNCAELLESKRMIKRMVGEVEYKNAPPSLKKNIQIKLRDYTGEDSTRPGLAQWLSLSAGSLLVGSLATWVFMVFVLTAPLQTGLVDEVISSHVRSLMVDHMTDIKTSDRHTVKPWFNGKLDFSPPIVDLKKEGFELIGGRLDYMLDKPVSAVVYKRRAHVINLFIMKNDTDNDKESTKLIHRNGYNIIFWKVNGLDYWLISDLNKKELRQFADLTVVF